MRRWWLVAAAWSACAAPMDASDDLVWGRPGAPAAGITHGQAYAGYPWTVQGFGVPEGLTVQFVVSVQGPGAGPCLPQLAGACFGVSPAFPIGRATAGADGLATLTRDVPTTAAGPLWLQGALFNAGRRGVSPIYALTVLPADTDADMDGVPDGREVMLGLDITTDDSDGDGLTDLEELDLYGTDPLSADTDGDRLTDLEELLTHGTSPLLADTDGDGATDFHEVDRGLDPTDPDMDGDGQLDGYDVYPQTPDAPDPFVVDDVVVSNPAQALADPEFDPITQRFVWQDYGSREVWLGDIDPATGAFVPPNGKGTLVDTGAQRVVEGRNGPEWVTWDADSAVVYTKPVQGQLQVWWGHEVGTTGAWTAEPLPGITPGAVSPTGSLGPSDPDPRVLYTTYDQTLGLRVGWRELFDDSASGTTDRLVLYPKWVDGQRQFIGAARVGDINQPHLFDIDAGTLTALTNDATDKTNVWMVDIPSFQGDRGLMVSRGVRQREATELALYREVGGVFTEVATWPTVAAYPYVISAEPFYWQGKPYASFVSSQGSGNHDEVPSVIMITNLDPADPTLVRLVSGVSPVNRKDAEPYTGGDHPWVYYTVNPEGSPKAIRRCALGL